MGNGAFRGNSVTLQAVDDGPHPNGTGTLRWCERSGQAMSLATTPAPTTMRPSRFLHRQPRPGRPRRGPLRVAGCPRVLGWWWRYEDAYPTSTQLRIAGAIYRFDARGCMVTGWVSEGGHWFYYGPSGSPGLGLRRGTWYCLDPSAVRWPADGPRCTYPGTTWAPRKARCAPAGCATAPLGTTWLIPAR